MTNTSDMARKQMGLIKVKNKTYSIYEGLNVIGRDLKATVLVKDEAISRQHAVISVVDENTHLVSDFGSSNGTCLEEECLIPYKFYRINDQERITIGDLRCFYQKTTGSYKLKDTSTRINENAPTTESPFDGHDALTQILPKNINEPIGQSVVNSVNDSQDSAFCKQLQNPDKNANESLLDNDDFIPPTQDFDKPTQKIVIVSKDTSHESNKQSKQNQLIFETNTQDDSLPYTKCNDDILANETLQLSMNNRGNIGVEVDETMLGDIESDNEPVDMLNTEQVSQCIQGPPGAKVTRKSRIHNQKQSNSGENVMTSTVIDSEKCNKPACENDDKKYDNLETSFKNADKNEHVTMDTSERGNGKSTINIDKVTVNLESAVGNNDDDSKTDLEIGKGNIKNSNVKNVSANVDDDDSESDVDDKTNKKKVTRCRRLRKQLEINSKNIDDDSETDMEDFSTVKSKQLGTKVQIIQSDSETDIENNKNLEKLKDDSRCSANNNNELNEADNVVEISSGSETEIEDEDIITKLKNLEAISTSKGECTTEQTVSEKKENVAQYCFSSDEEMDLLAPSEKLTDNSTDKNMQLSETQQRAEHRDHNESGCEDIESVACSKRSNEETYSLAPTQLLEPLQTSSDTIPYEVSIHEAETQIVQDVDKPASTDKEPKPVKKDPRLSDLVDGNERKKICEVSYSLAPAQSLKQTTPSSCSSSLAPTQLLQSAQKATDTKSNEMPIEEAETQLVDHVGMPAKSNQQKGQTEESCSLAPTQLLQPALISSNVNQNEILLEETETQTQGSSDNNQHEKQVEDLDYLAPTQLLEHSASKRNDEDIDYLAPTQLIHSEARSTNNKQRDEQDDFDYLPPTQPLGLNSSKSIQNEDYLAPTQLLSLRKEDRNIEDEENVNSNSNDEFPEKLPSQSTSNMKNNSTKEIVPEDSDDEMFLAPTQKLPLSIKKSLCKKSGLPEDKCSTPTQNMPANQSETNEDDDESIFSAPTQKLTTSTRISLGMKRKPEENEDAEDDDLLAPTQLLKMNTNVPKSPEIYDFDFSYTDDLHYINVDDASDDTSMRLGISCTNEAEDFIAPTQKLELPKNVLAGSASKKGKSGKLTEVLNIAKLPEPETQLEVDFTLSTQKLYLEKTTSRPNNPLAHMFDEETETDSSQTLSSNIETSDTSLIEQSKKRRFDDDTEKANSKKSKRNIRQATNKIDVILADTARRTSKRAEIVKSKYSKANLSLQEGKHGETSSTPKIPKSKIDKNAETLFEERVTITPSTSDTNLKRKVSGDKHREKDKGDKSRVTEIEKNLDTPKRMSTRAGRKTEERELEIPRKMAGRKAEERELETPRKMAGRKAEERELETPRKMAGRKAEERELESPRKMAGRKAEERELESPRKMAGRKAEERELETPRKMAGRKAEERKLETPRKMALRKGKKLSDTKLEPPLEDKKGSVIELLTNNEMFDVKVVVSKLHNNEENKKEEVHYKKPFDKQAVPKKETRRSSRNTDISSTMPQEMKSVVNTRTTRSKFISPEESVELGASKENISELVDTGSKTRKPRQNANTTRTRQTQNKSVDNEDEPIEIEDSDDSTNSNIEEYIRKKVLKVDYTDESCSGSSVASAVVPNLRHNKRSLKIQDYSSDENLNKNTNSGNTFCDTPNKRRKYQPLNITTNSSQTSNSDTGSVKHKVVFTMLNKPEFETAVKTLGGTTVDSVHTCTVLVTNKISRSLKFLIAVSLGKPIVGIKWIIESRKKKMFLDPWNYILDDPESENNYKFSLKESLERARTKILLTGYTILLVVNKNFEVLKEIIETCGGKCVTRAPAKSAGVNVVVVAYEDEKSKYSRYLKQRTVVAAEAIFSGVLTQQLNFENHLLS